MSQSRHPESFADSFVHRPEELEAARQPCGGSHVVLQFPSGPVSVAGLSPSQKDSLICGFTPLDPEEIRDGGESGTRPIRLFSASPDAFRDVNTRGWSYWLDTARDPHTVRLAGMSFFARLDFRPSLHGSLWTAFDGGADFISQFENFLRVFLAYGMLATGGALLHSSAIVFRERAFLFVGSSGAGKSTVAAMSRSEDHTVLSDDLNPVLRRSQPEGLWVAGLPLPGTSHAGVSGTFPLAGLFRLHKGHELKLHPLSTAETLATLLASSPYVNHDPHRVEPLIENLTRLARCTPSFELSFSLQDNIWDAIDTRFPQPVDPVSGRLWYTL